jgi:hypothetical protein
MRRTHQSSSKVGFASLLIVEVLRNLSDFELRLVRKNQEEEQNSSEFFEATFAGAPDSVRHCSDSHFLIASIISHEDRHQRKHNTNPDGYHQVIVNGREEFDNPCDDRYRRCTGRGEEGEKVREGHRDAGKGPLPGLPVADAVPSIPRPDKRGYAVEDCEGNERRHDCGDRKQDDAGKGAHGKEERPLPRQGIAPVAVLHERGDARDPVPAEDEVNEDYSKKKASRHNCDNNGVVKEEYQRGDAKAEAEVDELTDDLLHYGKSGNPVNKIPPVAGDRRNCADLDKKKIPVVVVVE